MLSAPKRGKQMCDMTKIRTAMADGGSYKESLDRHQDGIAKDPPSQSSWCPSMARTLIELPKI